VSLASHEGFVEMGKDTAAGLPALQLDAWSWRWYRRAAQ
jgi:hypothetical protein